MVAKIKSGKSLTGALNYNENKVKQGKAELIQAKGYPKELTDLNFYDKLLRLTDLAEGNQRVQTNAVHISLNFPNGESLPDETLRNIVQDYMQGIGFEMQPWLVYRHSDAGHPHIHIVTTNIRRDGCRISLHYLGQNQSEKARKEIEVKYSLMKAEDQPGQKPNLKADATVAAYGKAETKLAITNIVNQVVRTYKFTSIPELNTVLRCYNIQADRGARDSRMFAREGLIYWILDARGNKIGVPIKASCIYGKPTLKTLEEKFRLNEQLRKPYKAGLIKTIDEVLSKPQTKRGFQKALREKGIRVILRQNDQGRIYGVTFVDQQHKAIFNGSDLGKAYSANLLSATFLAEPQKKPYQPNTADGVVPETENSNELFDILFAPEREDLAALNKFKKKKRKGLNL